VIVGTDGGDAIAGRGGDDDIPGKGNDTICEGPGTGEVYGQAGNHYVDCGRTAQTMTPATVTAVLTRSTSAMPNQPPGTSAPLLPASRRTDRRSATPRTSTATARSLILKLPDFLRVRVADGRTWWRKRPRTLQPSIYLWVIRGSIAHLPEVIR
jgi:hypothetical protein